MTVCVQAWYRDRTAALICGDTTSRCLAAALNTPGLVAVFPHPTQHPEPCQPSPYPNEQEGV